MIFLVDFTPGFVCFSTIALRVDFANFCVLEDLQWRSDSCHNSNPYIRIKVFLASKIFALPCRCYLTRPLNGIGLPSWFCQSSAVLFFQVVAPINKLVETVPFDAFYYSLDWHPAGMASIL